MMLMLHTIVRRPRQGEEGGGGGNTAFEDTGEGHQVAASSSRNPTVLGLLSDPVGAAPNHPDFEYSLSTATWWGRGFLTLTYAAISEAILSGSGAIYQRVRCLTVDMGGST